MSRLVEAKPRVRIAANDRVTEFASGEETGWQAQLKEYGERVAKYVPAEVLAFYLSAVQLIMTKQGAEHATFRTALFGVVGVIALVGTPLYLGLFAKSPKEKRVNQLMATSAFIVWAYAFPSGVFAELGWHEPVIAGLLLLLWSFISGLVQPRE